MPQTAWPAAVMNVVSLTFLYCMFIPTSLPISVRYYLLLNAHVLCFMSCFLLASSLPLYLIFLQLHFSLVLFPSYLHLILLLLFVS
jgi:hypothetical protein